MKFCLIDQKLVRSEDPEIDIQILVDGHSRSSIIELTGVAGSREDRHELPIGEEFIAVLNHLLEMRVSRESNERKLTWCPLTMRSKSNA